MSLMVVDDVNRKIHVAPSTRSQKEHEESLERWKQLNVFRFVRTIAERKLKPCDCHPFPLASAHPTELMLSDTADSISAFALFTRHFSCGQEIDCSFNKF